MKQLIGVTLLPLTYLLINLLKTAMDHARAYNGHDGHITSCCPVIFVLFLKAFRCDGHPQCHSSTVADMGQLNVSVHLVHSDVKTVLFDTALSPSASNPRATYALCKCVLIDRLVDDPAH